MCEYCERGIQLDTERDSQAVMVIRPAAIGWTLYVFERGSGAPTFAFRVPRCPACGRANRPC